MVFLGPSLPLKQARARVRAHFLPPARQGDVWRALALRPRAIALIDGVFEAQPSVWHHELLEAMGAGVAVFGASSMGALRAAELTGHGMIGVGQVFRWVKEGVVEDDAEVALLHADREHGYRPLTLPLVNVRHAAKLAQAAEVLSAPQASALVKAAQRVFYQQRHWPTVLEQVRWSESVRARWARFAAPGLEDLKARDALECLALAGEFVRAGLNTASTKQGAGSAWVRRRKLREGAGVSSRGEPLSSGEGMEALRGQPAARELAEDGLRRLLLAGWARSMGLAVDEEDRLQAERAWLSRLGVTARTRRRFLRASGLDEADLGRLTEAAALEALVLEHAARLLPDGPSWEEGLAAQARWSGRWAALSRRKRRP